MLEARGAKIGMAVAILIVGWQLLALAGRTIDGWLLEFFVLGRLPNIHGEVMNFDVLWVITVPLVWMQLIKPLNTRAEQFIRSTRVVRDDTVHLEPVIDPAKVTA